MKNILLKVSIILSIALFFSCSSDDDGATSPVEPTSPTNPELSVQDLTQSVPENQEVAAVVAQFAITQENLSAPLVFELLEVSRIGSVTVNNEGQLLVADATAFDFERLETISGQVRASSGDLVQTVSFTLNITDEVEDAVPFVTRWNLELGGLTIQLPLYEGTANDPTAYDFRVDWGDGSPEGLVTSFDDPDAQHTYASVGIKTVIITGILKGFSFGENLASSRLIVDMAQWGDVQLGNAGGYFAFCENLTGFSADDTPILKGVTNMTRMFREARAFNQDLSDWDVSNVTLMTEMFNGASSFNGDISKWNVSNVMDMELMFSLAVSFNEDISNWDVSNVTNMRAMFAGLSLAPSIPTIFNQDISNWDVSNVTDMGGMFSANFSFNQDISNWDVSNVTHMGFMFTDAANFSQDLSNWATGNVTTCENFANGSMLTAEQLPTQGICF